MDADWLSVAEAAGRLQVNARQVRRLINAGRLPAQRVAGGAWMLDPLGVSVQVFSSAPSGRPLSPANAWRFLRLVARSPEDASAVDRSIGGWGPDNPLAGLNRAEQARLRRLCDDPPDAAGLGARLRSRAQHARVDAHRSLLSKVVDDRRVWVGGAEAVAARGGGIAAGARIRIYVRAGDSTELTRQYRLRPDPEGPVDLMVIPAAVPESLLPEAGRFMPIEVGWVDCFDEPDSRARHAATEWAARRAAVAG